MGAQMILPDFILPSRINQCWEYSGMDSWEDCFDKNHFKQYPHKILYQYNSRGYRDHEWPDSLEELKNAVWCVGDSFTVGLGSPIEHTWPFLLQKQTGRRVINISMDGASNDWIARRVKLLQDKIGPTHIVIMWSYLHRRESTDQSKCDEGRRICNETKWDQYQDLLNFKNCIDMVKTLNGNTVQLAVPHYVKLDSNFIADSWQNIRGGSWPYKAPTTIQEMLSLPSNVQLELKKYFKVWSEYKKFLETQELFLALQNNIITINRIDTARDGHHFDLITAQWVVDQVVNQLSVANHL